MSVIGTAPDDAVADRPDPVDATDDLGWDVMQGLARALNVKEAGLTATLEAVLRTAVDAVTPATAAGVNLLRRGSFEPQAVLGRPPHRLDAWQRDQLTGPCVDASRLQAVVRVDDTALEPRWPGFGRLAADLGVCSMLCVPLWVDEARLGSVSLYADTTRAFSPRDETVATVLATQAAFALGGALRTEQLRTMAANRDLIGQAKGILMERHKITADGAFDLLRVASQESNRKLVEVAEGLVATGTLG